MLSRRYRIVALSFWPGLPQIWAGQIIMGLIVALFFTAIFNLSLVSLWIYTDLFDTSARQLLCIVTVIVHLSMTAWTAMWAWKFHPERFHEEIQKLFRSSSDFYLQGRWAESRDQLENLVALDSSDTEALLRLTRVLERTGETALARRTLDQCRETPGAASWSWEIAQIAKRLSDSSLDESGSKASRP